MATDAEVHRGVVSAAYGHEPSPASSTCGDAPINVAAREVAALRTEDVIYAAAKRSRERSGRTGSFEEVGCFRSADASLPGLLPWRSDGEADFAEKLGGASRDSQPE